ncbi:MAG: sulfur carrier protein ThiS [Actinobacteria bacterium]|nr:sulfur carrier protein ThiS [Actinomycetota bacterium]
MTVTINGEPRDVDPDTTVADLVSELGADRRRHGVAVAVNGEVIRRADWDQCTVDDGDAVEVLAAIQGGT